MGIAQSVWGIGEGVALEARPPQFIAPKSVEQVLAAATASQKRERSMKASLDEAERDAELRSLTSATAEDVQKWLDNLAKRKDKKGRPVANAKQYAAVEKVAWKVTRNQIGEGALHRRARLGYGCRVPDCRVASCHG